MGLALDPGHEPQIRDKGMIRVWLSVAGLYCAIYGIVQFAQRPPEFSYWGTFTEPAALGAVGFLLCGLTLLLRAGGLLLLSVLGGFALELLGISQLAGNAFGFAGRSSSSPALVTIGDPLCFLLTGIAVQFLGYRRGFRFRSAFVGMCGSMVFGYGLISLSNSLAGLGHQPVLHSIGFVAVGGYLVTAAWNDTTRSMRPFWFNTAIGTGSLTANVVLWQGLAQSAPGEGNAHVFAAAVLYAGLLAVGSLTVATHFAQAAHLRAASMAELNLGLVQEISRRTKVEASLDQQIRQLASLKRIDTAILAAELPEALAVVAEEAVNTLKAAAATIHVAQPDNQDLYCAAMAGAVGPLRSDFHLAPSAEDLNRALVGAEPMLLESVSLPVKGDGSNTLMDYQAIPMMSRGRLLGVIELASEMDALVSPEQKSFIDALAGQTCIALEHALYFQTIENSNAELLEAYDATLSGWARALELRDSETQDHTTRVTDGAVMLARRFNMPEDELLHVRRGALLHDIGKIGIPDAILRKPGPLDDDEWAMMRQHPIFAFELLKTISYLRPALDIPHYHHEKWDGSGYPDGLAGTDIPFAARMFALIDVWDALASDRPYRDAWPSDKIKAHIRSLSGSHFDPRVVDVFLEMLENGVVVATVIK